MKNRGEDEKILIQYLLGELPEKEQMRLEEEFFTDDESYEQLLSLENELMYDYAQGRLSARERELFEKRFLVTGADRKKAELAGAFIKKISKESPEPNLAVPDRTGWLRSLSALFAFQNPVMRFSLAAAALVLAFVAAWSIFENLRLRDQVKQMQSERKEEQNKIERQTADERARREQLSQDLERERNRRSQLEQELAKQQTSQQTSQNPTEQQENSFVASFVLTPGLIRDGGEIKRLRISPEIRSLRVQLDIKRKGQFKSYRAALRTVEGNEIWSKDMLRARRTDSGQAATVTLPAGLLSRGDYELTLSGLTNDGDFEEVGDYYFSVVK